MGTSPTDSQGLGGPAAEQPPAGPVFSRGKKIQFSIILAALMVLGTEAVVRVGFFLADDFSPYYLKFGFVPDIANHSAEFDGYTKFQPNSVYHYRANRDRTIAMHINADGFRAATDFTRPKPPGEFRVVALGESSTFGLVTDDDETYPYLLEQRLAARFAPERVEVLNLGIPHYRTNNILAVARAEVAALQPDVVTLYAGYNNSMAAPPEQVGAAYHFKNWLKSHSITYLAIHPYVVTVYQEVSKLLKRDLVGLPHLQLPIELSQERVTALRAAARAEFRQDLDSLATVVESMGATLVPITQSYTLRRLKGGLEDKWRPYWEEVAYVDSLLVANGHIPAPYATLLIHRDIVEEIREVARLRGLFVIDGIAALDADRELVMGTFVHLTLEGNSRLAAAIEAGLAEAKLLPGTDGSPPVDSRSY